MTWPGLPGQTIQHIGTGIPSLLYFTGFPATKKIMARHDFSHLWCIIDNQTIVIHAQETLTLGTSMTTSTSTRRHEEEKDILFGMINRFIGYFTRDAQRESTNNEELEYPFVPMDTRQMIEQIRVARAALLTHHNQEEPLNFIDIGCGIGNVLLAAEQMDFAVFGIEKDPFPCQIAQKLIDENLVVMADIWEFSEYNRFDVIYYFRPFHDGKTQRRFELLIENELKPGGILIANRKMSESINHDPRFKRLHPDLPVWEKPVTLLASNFTV